MAVRTSFTAGEVLAAADLTDTFGAKLNLAGGKILQVVRATDSTNRTTTSTSFVDASLSVTITPQRSTSAVLLIYKVQSRVDGSSGFTALSFSITDSSNNPISGSEIIQFGVISNNNVQSPIIIGYATPATTSATTFKARFRTENASNTATIQNATATGQLYAIEVSA